MNSRIGEKSAAIVQKRQRHKLFKRVLSVLMALTVFTTTYSLILPAITMERAYCGETEHVHSKAAGCYTEEKTIVCGQVESEHKHTEACYEDQRVLACGQEESAEHTHSDECYKTEKTLKCQGNSGGCTPILQTVIR